MSDAQREQLSAILEDIYAGFTQGIAASRGKSAEEVQLRLPLPAPVFCPAWSLVSMPALLGSAC
jgi:hypothetical protein